MAANDNKELMKFLEKQFEGIYKRLDDTATKEDLAVSKEEIMRHTGVLIEGVHHKLDLLVEGREATHERIERDKDQNIREHGQLEKMALINTADISKLDQRVGRLEGNI